MQPFCTPAYTRHIYETDTQNKRNLSTIRRPNKAHENKKQHHNTVFFNTTAWGSHPYALREGPGTTPLEKCQRWSTVGPLGAAMRLTALRQSPKDVSKPMNPRQMKRKSAPNDKHSTLLCYSRYTSTKSEKCGRAGYNATPQSGAVRAPLNTGRSGSLPELATRNTWARRDHLPLHAAPNENSLQLPLLTGAQYLTRTLHERRPGNKMRLRYRGEP